MLGLEVWLHSSQEACTPSRTRTPTAARTNGAAMFVNIVEFPPIVPGKEQEFEDWFAWSNSLYQPFPGFISRRLLKPTNADGPYVGIVEHESEETFMAMHTSDTRAQARTRVEECFGGGRPTPRFYTVVVDSPPATATQ